MHAALTNPNARGSFNEDDVERLFQDVYLSLGYQHVGQDILGKRKGASGIPDVLLTNSDQSIQVVVELKKPAEDLAHHEDQLKRYVRELKAPFGILSNGKQLWLYERTGRAVDRDETFEVSDLARSADMLTRLRKQTIEPTNLEQVQRQLDQARQEGLVLSDVSSLASQQFLNAFALEPDRPFGEIVRAMQALLEALLPVSDFVQGAFDFWQKTYARDLSSDDIPNLWKPLLPKTNKTTITQFTYVLETSYLLAARLMLAKAIQDHDTDRRINAAALVDRFGSVLAAKVDPRTGRLEPTTYLETAQTLFDDYATTLFTSIYAQDLFDWWRDYPAAPPEQQNRVALAFARLLLSLVRFDFSQLQGDLLGELYQNYFDPETRKALGEFYTPPEVVEFILDEVGYDGTGRLLDPATGSGTFLIHALRRYLRANEQRDPADTLRGLTQDFQIVAFDVNPFAVMMAQVNMAAQLVPLYTRAIVSDGDFTLRRLPIVRTDSLRQEIGRASCRERV